MPYVSTLPPAIPANIKIYRLIDEQFVELTIAELAVLEFPVFIYFDQGWQATNIGDWVVKSLNDLSITNIDYRAVPPGHPEYRGAKSSIVLYENS